MEREGLPRYGAALPRPNIRSARRSIFRTLGMAMLGMAASAFSEVRAAEPIPVYEVIHSFDGAEGAGPNGGLTLGTNGELYGITGRGGAHNGGTAFKIAPDGTFVTLHSFDPEVVGAPFAGVARGRDGNFYGVTRSRIRIQLAVVDFGSIGQRLEPPVPPLPDVSATVYRISPAGVFSILRPLDFEPQGRLLGSLDGNLYGTSRYGTNLKGNIFRVTPGGEVTTLHSFNGTDGSEPDPGTIGGTGTNDYGAGLVEHWAGEFVGLTRSGVRQGLGTLFQYSTTLGFTTLHTFTAEEGLYPGGGLLYRSDGVIFGTTNEGGPNHAGTVFKYSPGSFTTLHSFSTTDGNGWYPESLTLAENGRDLYGTNSMGAPTGTWNGTIFRITKDGDFSTVHSFTAASGEKADGGLVLGPDGNLYGMTASGGDYGLGTLFRIRMDGTNRMPLAVDDEVSVVNRTARPDDPFGTAFSSLPNMIDVLRNDSDPDSGSVRLIHVGPPKHGRAFASYVAYLVGPINGEYQQTTFVSYVPDEGFAGEDDFTYTIADSNGGTATGTVRVHVLPDDRVPVVAFTPAKYSGLISPQRGRPAGTIRVSLLSSGAFTGQIRLGTELSSFQGGFGANRAAELDVNFPKLGIVKLTLQVSSDGNDLDGSVEMTSGSSYFSTRRALLVSAPRGNPSPRYTVLLLPPSDPAVPQRGTGYALIRFGRSGSATVVGYTSDGNGFSTSTALQPDGTLPIYAISSHSAGMSLLSGELTFTSGTDFSTCSGDLLWTRTVAGGSSERSLAMIGAAYNPSRESWRGFRDSEFTAKVDLAGTIVSGDVTISGAGRLRPDGSDIKGLKLQFNSAVGTFSGRLIHPTTGVRIPVRGAVLQSSHRGAGFAGDANVSLEPK